VKAVPGQIVAVIVILAGIGATQLPFARDGRSWNRAQKAGTLHAYREYERDYPEGRHLAEARTRIDEMTWDEAIEGGTIRSIQAYVDAYPQGRFRDDALHRIDALRVDDKPFLMMLQRRTPEALQEFLAEFPGHVRQAEAQQAFRDVTEGRDLLDWIAAKQIETQALGGGIRTVRLRIRRLMPRALLVRVPAGTFFVPADKSSQNMVATDESRIEIGGDGWTTLDVPVACANRSRKIPGEKETFTVERSPRKADLAKLMAWLDKADTGYPTKQAAVWIVSDDATYDDLGILTSSWRGPRVIREPDVALAMKLCDEAGIDIARRAIWKDRDRIFTGLLEESQARDWLKQRTSAVTN